MPASKSIYDILADDPSADIREEHIETGFIGKLQGLNYEYRPDITNRATLEANFRREAQAGENQSEFHIRPNKLVEYKYVAAVLASAQRLGVTKVGIVGNEQFMQ